MHACVFLFICFKNRVLLRLQMHMQLFYPLSLALNKNANNLNKY